MGSLIHTHSFSGGEDLEDSELEPVLGQLHDLMTKGKGDHLVFVLSNQLF